MAGRVQGFSNRFRPSVRLISVEVVRRIDKQGVSGVLMTRRTLHEGVQQGVPALRWQGEPGRVVGWVVEPGHHGGLLTHHLFQSWFKGTAVKQWCGRLVVAGEQGVSGDAEATASQKSRVGAPISVSDKDGITSFCKVGSCKVQSTRTPRRGGRTGMDTHGIKGRTMLSKRKGYGEVKEGWQSLHGCIGCEFGCRCLTNGFVHHRVDRQRPIVVEERTDRPVHSIRPGGSSLLVAGEPAENHVVAGLLVAVTGEKLHGAVLVHGPSNWDSLLL